MGISIVSLRNIYIYKVDRRPGGLLHYCAPSTAYVKMAVGHEGKLEISQYLPKSTKTKTGNFKTLRVVFGAPKAPLYCFQK